MRLSSRREVRVSWVILSGMPGGHTQKEVLAEREAMRHGGKDQVCSCVARKPGRQRWVLLCSRAQQATCSGQADARTWICFSSLCCLHTGWENVTRQFTLVVWLTLVDHHLSPYLHISHIDIGTPCFPRSLFSVLFSMLLMLGESIVGMPPSDSWTGLFCPLSGSIRPDHVHRMDAKELRRSCGTGRRVQEFRVFFAGA